MASTEQMNTGQLLVVDPVMTTEVGDYSSVPPASEYSCPIDMTDSVNLATSPKESSLDTGIWDYGQHGGANLNVVHSGADFNMEAPISEDDVMRAGGLGARDGLDSFLPAAADATDYEESLKDAMEYEDAQPAVAGAVTRPGVGFVEDQQRKVDGGNDVQPKQTTEDLRK